MNPIASKVGQRTLDESSASTSSAEVRWIAGNTGPLSSRADRTITPGSIPSASVMARSCDSSSGSIDVGGATKASPPPATSRSTIPIPHS